MIANVTDELVLPAVASRTRIGYCGNIWLSTYKNQNVIVKRFLENTTYNSRFQELELLNKLSNQHIINLIAAGPNIYNGLIDFLVLEYASCGDLSGVIFGNNFEYNLSNALSWMLQASEALAYLHADCLPPVIHNDVKPANFLLFDRGALLKLTDFGSATTLYSDVTKLEAENKSHSGTYAYMAPELLGNISLSHNVQSDVFSTAITFWEIFAGKHAIAVDEPCFVTIYKRVTKKQRPPPLINCPDLLQSMLNRSWDDNPKRRPQLCQIVAFLRLIKTCMIDTHLLQDPLLIPSVFDRKQLAKEKDIQCEEWESEDDDNDNWNRKLTNCPRESIEPKALPAEYLQDDMIQSKPFESTLLRYDPTEKPSSLNFTI